MINVQHILARVAASVWKQVYQNIECRVGMTLSVLMCDEPTSRYHSPVHIGIVYNKADPTTILPRVKPNDVS